MLFSVITPSYNTGRFLEEAIRSVLQQRRYRDIEVEYIVVDGLSDDSTRDILEKYRHDITRIVSEKDSGPVNAINKGLRLVTGDVVAWLNADDRYLPGAFNRSKTLWKPVRIALSVSARVELSMKTGMKYAGRLRR